MEMKVLIGTSEIYPYSKTGGLADMAGSLTVALAKKGVEVIVVTPLYKGIADKFPDLQDQQINFQITVGSKTVPCSILGTKQPDSPKILFVKNDSYFDRDGIYQSNGLDFADNAERFIFFSKCIVKLAKDFLKPDIVHVHDWQTGLVSLIFHHESSTSSEPSPPVVFTIHNLAYQGNFPPDFYPLTNLPWHYYNIDGVEFFGQMSLLKAGIVFATKITTVSPTYSKEIQTLDFGCGLDGVIRKRKSDLIGILNGVDYNEWNPTRNKWLPHKFSSKNLRGKLLNKRFLQKSLNLIEDPSIPVFANVGRLAEQKGLDILLPALEQKLHSQIQFVLLGAGDPEYEKKFLSLADKFPGKVAVKLGFNHGLPHQIFAGSDFFVMPSRFEPCGLSQLYALKFASIPIVRAVGGLNDSVIDIRENLANADGIKFFEYSTEALLKAFDEALVVYQNKGLLEFYRKNAMAADFSIEKTADNYIKVYSELKS